MPKLMSSRRDSAVPGDFDALWERISRHEIAGPDFLERLATEKVWSAAFAKGAVAEYRRFAFLCVTEGTVMTPSAEVDEVWHLHLLYSRAYWEIWCGEVLDGPLHHEPTRGGPDQARYFRSRYAETLAAYERRFGPPPLAYWPATRERFAARRRFRAVDADRAIVLPRLWSARFWRQSNGDRHR